ncbi:MAG: diaminopimelate decarboxylase [Clostridium sp.]|uniref:diaminopimelate decarboxylase n=1 Tax=Clostridium sp. TaxID=1506 RepID=UPI0025C25B8F|nr:diaminopimelate decarboxylase [Clostridium sp.]MCH3964911.1 diaminopimelate decarboxylase [Clostridium sp.]MCI1716595.1 diaminopimelate decarboxylase [Clostridium sp.]MCI1800923.1 diaminopimelate decarboxylase [Clostridium sp.]MCI1814772.1 diaminopimelate decarboxylase [Clostridium sp.]MCI1871670.1 diaminopimelate decarboxylase [Clostridium sp.]
MKLFDNMEVKNNTLYIDGVNTVDLAKKFGTPLYVVDEELVRDKCRRYYTSFKADSGINKVAYAGKAFLTLAMCQLINEEGLCLDVVSGGELYTAYISKFPMNKIYFHGNNKTMDEIKMAVRLGAGKFVVDNIDEMKNINSIAGQENKIQDILLRVTPGIEAHTHEYIRTGQIDSKFGFSIIDNKVEEAVELALKLPNIKLSGFHSHIGSQIFEVKPYCEEVDVMLSLIGKIQNRFNICIEELDLGGGFGIYYVEGDKPKPIEEFCSIILKEAEKKAREIGINLPCLVIEPGRSIVGNAGTTLYTVGTIKEIPDIRKYVSIDGGMADNIRPALYGARYECAVSNKVHSDNIENVTIAGKFCESGDILIENVELPKIEKGDILTVFTTGAYGYSMASNYNKAERPAVVFASKSRVSLVCKRQSLQDIIKGELML